MMECRPFGNTGLHVSAIGLGTTHLGKSTFSDEDAESLLNQMVDLGITLIDTAKAYGKAEERIGKFLSHKREKIVISSKAGKDFDYIPKFSYEDILWDIDNSLKLLKTDHIDILHLHSCTLEELKKGEAILALEKAKELGKIRFMAFSGENEALTYALSTGRFDSIQCSINICDQRSVDDHLPEASKQGLGIIAKRPMANAPWRFDEPPEGHYSAEYWYRLRKMNIDRQGLDWPELVLRFSLFTGGVSCGIIGTRNMDHLKENIKAFEKGPLPGDLVRHIKEEFSNNDDDWIGLI
jgi:aryl-alcohol dehydrogenase-like predicted oxidoreductase